MRTVALAFAIFLSGCAELNAAFADLNQSAEQLMGTYSAPVLGGSPRPSGCSDSKCRSLDDLEAKGYDLARAKKITWVRLVNAFYKRRSELYPDSQDGSGVYEIISHQRALAEQMDLNRLTESQWAYLVEKKYGEVSARIQALNNSRPRSYNCITSSVGTASNPEFRTACN